MAIEKAMFGAGCFWGVEMAYASMDGVVSTKVGYSGGVVQDPTYRQVCTGQTGHAEVILIEFDSDQISFQALLDKLFEIHDPTTLNRQGPDIGTQYRSAVFFYDEVQQKQAESTIEALNASGSFKGPIVTEISPAKTFYAAEDYHQKYFERNPVSCHV